MDREFYLSTQGRLISLVDEQQPPPLTLQSFTQIERWLNQLQTSHPPACQCYALTYEDFIERRRRLRQAMS